VKEAKELVAKKVEVCFCPYCSKEVALPQAKPKARYIPPIYPRVYKSIPTVLKAKPKPPSGAFIPTAWEAGVKWPAIKIVKKFEYAGKRVLNAPTPIEKRVAIVDEYLAIPRESPITLKAFAVERGLPYPTVKVWVWQYRHGKFKNRSPNYRSEIEKAAIIDEYFNTPGASIQLVARKHDLPKATVRYWIRQRYGQK
jgi:hypothetical protein